MYLGLGGCVLVALCACIVAAGIAGVLYYRSTRLVAAEPAAEYILDASPRMDLPTAGGTRLAVARGVLAEIIRPAEASVTAGLRVFGSGANTEACRDTNLIVALAPASQALIADQLLGLSTGKAADAALAEAMIAAIKDLAAKKGPHSLVVVTGGQDSCNPEAGQLIAQEATRAGIQLQTFVIGFEVPESESVAIKGLVDPASGGQYIDAPDEASLRAAVQKIQNQIDRPATQSQHGNYASQTACDHPYFPLRPGNTWTYQGQDTTMTWTVNNVTGDLSNATADMTMDIGQNATFNLQWSCSASGIDSYEFGTLAMAGLGNMGKYSVRSHSGAFLLPPDQLTPGATWDNAYTIDFTIDTGGVGTFTSTVDAADSYIAGVVESITTAAGTFDALRVDSTGTTTTTTTGGVGGGTFNTANTFWYQYGVGLAKFTSTSDSSTSTTELVSYSVK